MNQIGLYTYINNNESSLKRASEKIKEEMDKYIEKISKDKQAALINVKMDKDLLAVVVTDTTKNMDCLIKTMKLLNEPKDSFKDSKLSIIDFLINKMDQIECNLSDIKKSAEALNFNIVQYIVFDKWEDTYNSNKYLKDIRDELNKTNTIFESVFEVLKEITYEKVKEDSNKKLNKINEEEAYKKVDGKYEKRD